MPIYCNDSILLYVSDPKGFEDYIKQAELKKLEEDTTNSEND